MSGRVEKPIVGRQRHIRGLPAIDLIRIDLGTHLAWRAVVAGEPWVIQQKSEHAPWQGATEDGLVETPRARSLTAVVRWIAAHQQKWLTQLRVIRHSPATA